MKKSLLFFIVLVAGLLVHALNNIDEKEKNPGPAGTGPDIMASGGDTPGTKKTERAGPNVSGPLSSN